ncbi:MAG: distal tail protein Dit, partial [Paraclostridium sp.]
MGIKIEFNDIKLHEIIKIEKIDTTIMSNRSNISNVIPIRHGSFYNGHRFEEKKFTLSCGIVAKNIKEHNNTITELSEILNVTKPVKFKINDSNIVYYVVPTGESAIDKKTKCVSKFNIEFICHDAFGYDENYAGVVGSNKTFDFKQLGTLGSLPRFGFTFSQDSTFLYLTNSKKESILIGTPKNEQIPTKPIQTTLVDNDCSDSSKFTNGGNVVVSDNRLTGGTYGVGVNGSAIVAKSFGNATDKKWNGTT